MAFKIFDFTSNVFIIAQIIYIHNVLVKKKSNLLNKVEALLNPQTIIFSSSEITTNKSLLYTCPDFSVNLQAHTYPPFFFRNSSIVSMEIRQCKSSKLAFLFQSCSDYSIFFSFPH